MSITSAWCGAVTPSGVRVKAVTAATSARLAVSTSKLFTSPTYFGPVTPDAQGVVDVSATGLSADTAYWYAIEEDGTLDSAQSGTFTTAPAAGSQKSFTLAAMSCALGVNYPWTSAGRISNSPVFSTIEDLAPTFLVHLGDMHYRDSAPFDVDHYRTAYDDVLSAPNQASLYRSAPLVYMWDDHDYGADNSDGSLSTKANAAQVYRERVPSYPLSDSVSTYHSFEWGRVLFIVSDTRYNRTPDTVADSPSKTMLGQAQKDWMQGVLSSSTAELLVWCNPTPWLGFANDTWAGFTYERDELVSMFTSTGWIDRMVCLNGDYHGNAMDTGGGNAWGGFPVYLWCSLDSVLEGQGNPTNQYDMGPTSPGPDRYGTLAIDDQGSYLKVTGTGYVGTSIWRQHTFYVTVAADAQPPRSTTAIYDDTLARVRVTSAETAPTTYEALSDGFARTVSNGWGTADTGQAWTASPDATAFSVGGNVGKESHSATGARLFTRAGDYTDVEIAATVRCPVTPTGGGVNGGLTVRATSDNDCVLAWVSFNTSGTLQLSLYKRIGGAFTSLGQVTLTDTFDPAVAMWVRLNATGSTVSARAWADGTAEPGAWQLTGTLGAGELTSGGVGTYTTVPATNTNGTFAFEFDNLRTTDPPDVYLDVERSTNQITWNAVRGGMGLTVAPGQSVTVDDYEYTPDVPNYYRATIRDLALTGDVLDQSIAVNTPNMTSVWLKSASRPFLNRPVPVVSMGPVTRAARGSTFDVIGRRLPVSVTGLRGARRFDLTVMTEDASAADALDALLGLGEPVLVHVPQGCPLPIPTMYASVGDTSTDQPSRYSPIELVTLPLTEVAAPGPDVVGATVTWASIANDYATWADLQAAQPTWADVLALIGDPADVVVG